MRTVIYNSTVLLHLTFEITVLYLVAVGKTEKLYKFQDVAVKTMYVSCMQHIDVKIALMLNTLERPQKHQ